MAPAAGLSERSKAVDGLRHPRLAGLGGSGPRRLRPRASRKPSPSGPRACPQRSPGRRREPFRG
ncbi:hypothetical protein [Ornithinimicrobium kibberense]|uniref:hypothetical protein n=1 Tax=Ornithinimicrobium kibberense TaxID=282060 RepID=UPI00361834F2